MKKVVILIDGPSLSNVLRDLRLPEMEICWDKLIYHLLVGGDELAGAKWFVPERMEDRQYTPGNIGKRVVYEGFAGYYHSYKQGDYEKIPVPVLGEIHRQCAEIGAWLLDQKREFSRKEHTVEQVFREYGDIEIVKKGVVEINPFTRECIGEKGVDVALAMEMASLCEKNSCDKIILMSGEYEYPELIGQFKDRKVEIHLFRLHRDFLGRTKNVPRHRPTRPHKVIDMSESEFRLGFLK